MGDLLEIEDLSVEFRTGAGVVRAVTDLHLSVGAGETLAIVGESGSGKSVTAHAVMGILDSPPARVPRGRIVFDGVDLLGLDRKARRRTRGAEIAMIFQDALSALNPLFTVGYQVAEMFREHRGMSMEDGTRKAAELLDLVRIPSARERVNDYPHQFSGGMRQRVMIAMAIALDPRLLIADEPTTALDVTVQAQIMRLLVELRQERGMGLILITHDLGVVANVADRVAVMYAGRVVEQSPVSDLYRRAAHPYTRALLDSIPHRSQRGGRLRTIEGQPPDLIDLPAGCAFHPRCGTAKPICSAELPPLAVVADGRQSACHFWEETINRE